MSAISLQYLVTENAIAPSIEKIFAMSDDQLFSKINSNSLHILQQFMPDRPSLNYSLQARPHNKTLIVKTTQLIVNIRGGS